MFENFPYTNFHDLNLDWIIQKILDAYSPDNPPPVGMVASVNGKTGIVVLTGDDIKITAGDPDSIKTILDNLAAGKQDAPAAAGTSGQFLGLDANGDPVWATPSGSGTTDYDDLTDKPQIEGVTLSGNKTLSDLGAQPAPAAAGTSGQFLGLDANGDPVWAVPSGSGTTNYNDLTNKPQVAGVTLSGNKTLSDLGAQPAPAAAGTAGQVLALDANGDPIWANQTATDYNSLNNQPQINGTTLTGNKSLSDLGIQPKYRLIQTITTDGIQTYNQLLSQFKTTLDGMSDIELANAVIVATNWHRFAAKGAGTYYFSMAYNTASNIIAVSEITIGSSGATYRAVLQQNASTTTQENTEYVPAANIDLKLYA